MHNNNRIIGMMIACGYIGVREKSENDMCDQEGECSTSRLKVQQKWRHRPHVWNVFSSLTHYDQPHLLEWELTERKWFWTVVHKEQSKKWCVSTARVDWPIAGCHSNLSDMLIHKLAPGEATVSWHWPQLQGYSNNVHACSAHVRIAGSRGKPCHVTRPNPLEVGLQRPDRRVTLQCMYSCTCECRKTVVHVKSLPTQVGPSS